MLTYSFLAYWTRTRPAYQHHAIPSSRSTNAAKSKLLGMLVSSLQKHPFLLAIRRLGRFARRNVCDSAAEIPYC